MLEFLSGSSFSGQLLPLPSWVSPAHGRGGRATEPTLPDFTLRLFLCVPVAEPITEGMWKAKTAEAKRQSNWYCSSCTTLEAPPPPPRRQQGAVWKVMAHTCWRSFVRWDVAGSKSNEMENKSS